MTVSNSSPFLRVERSRGFIACYINGVPQFDNIVDSLDLGDYFSLGVSGGLVYFQDFFGRFIL